MNKIMFLFFLFLLPIVFAQSELYYRIGDTVNLAVPCVNNNAVCGASSSCNISIVYPNGTNLVNIQAMTNEGNYFSYVPPSTDLAGEYKSYVYCADGANTGYTSFSYELTSNGRQNDIWAFIIACGVIIFFLVILGLYLDSSSPFPLKLTSFIFAIIFSILIPASFVVGDMQNTFWWVFIGFLVVFGGQLGMLAVYNLLVFFGAIVPKVAKK
jgi:hypothetical protein